MRAASRMAESTEQGATFTWCLPASMRASDRMSLITPRRCVPEFRMSAEYSLYLGIACGPNRSPAMISEKPMIAFSGVRSSWLILAMNDDLAELDASAAFAEIDTCTSRWISPRQRIDRKTSAAQIPDSRLIAQGQYPDMNAPSCEGTCHDSVPIRRPSISSSGTCASRSDAPLTLKAMSPMPKSSESWG